MPTLADAVQVLQSGDTSQPAITCYDRSGGPTDGERIELSGRVLLTWAAKAAGALQDELLVEPGTTVGLALPPHWRVGYWALATWWVGATLVTGPQAATADVLVTDDVALAADHHGEQVLVTLAGLARSHPGPVPAGVMDEARELASCPDRFVPLLRPQGPTWRGGPPTAPGRMPRSCRAARGARWWWRAGPRPRAACGPWSSTGRAEVPSCWCARRTRSSRPPTWRRSGWPSASPTSHLGPPTCGSPGHQGVGCHRPGARPGWPRRHTNLTNPWTSRVTCLSLVQRRHRGINGFHITSWCDQILSVVIQSLKVVMTPGRTSHPPLP